MLPLRNFPTEYRKEQTQTAPVADTPAAETPETAVPAIEMPTPDSDVANNLTVCSGCTKVIRGEIELPEKPPENDEGA